MFGWLGAKREKVIAFEAEAEIQKPVKEVYALLDLSSPHNRWEATGRQLTRDEVALNRFTMVDEQMPDLAFLFTVEDKEPLKRLVIRTDFIDDAAMGNLQYGRSEYQLVAINEDVCRVTLNETSILDPGLKKSEVRNETGMLCLAVMDDLNRLKVLAEEGPEAAAKAGTLDGMELELGALDDGETLCRISA